MVFYQIFFIYQPVFYEIDFLSFTSFVTLSLSSTEAQRTIMNSSRTCCKTWRYKIKKIRVCTSGRRRREGESTKKIVTAHMQKRLVFVGSHRRNSKQPGFYNWRRLCFVTVLSPILSLSAVHYCKQYGRLHS
jgi:hypothetical protein